MNRKAMPDNFPEIAPGMRTAEAAERWRVGMETARRWFLEAGIRPARAKHPGRPAGRFETRDSPEHIRSCLSCKRQSCSGSCEKMRK